MPPDVVSVGTLAGWAGADVDVAQTVCHSDVFGIATRQQPVIGLEAGQGITDHLPRRSEGPRIARPL